MAQPQPGIDLPNGNPAYGDFPMGKFVMSLALVTMLTGTAFLIAAPALVKSDYADPMVGAQMCLLRGIGCGR
jgi:hypothetical protein